MNDLDAQIAELEGRLNRTGEPPDIDDVHTARDAIALCRQLAFERAAAAWRWRMLVNAQVKGADVQQAIAAITSAGGTTDE